MGYTHFSAPLCTMSTEVVGSEFYYTGANVSFDAILDGISRTSGSWIADGFILGSSIVVTGSASNNGTFTIDNLSDSTIFVSQSLTNEAVGASVSIVGTPTTDTEVDPFYALTYIATSGVIALTLPDGEEGQYKEILMTVDGGDATVTITNGWSITSVVFDDVGDAVYLKFTDGKWMLMSAQGTPIVGGQADIQWQDEGVNLGTSGTVDTFNIVGPTTTAVRVGNTITLTDTSQVGVQYQDENVNLGTSGTVDTIDFQGAGITATRLGNEVTVTVAGAGAAQAQIQWEDEGVNLGTTGTVTEVDFVGAGVTATRVLDKVTVTIPAGGGGSGLTAYGYAAGQDNTVIGANADVVFDLGATPFPNVGFTSVPAPAGTSFVIATTGDYEFDFFVTGTHAAAATTPLQFAIFINGVIASVGGNAFEFNGELDGIATTVQSVRGQGIILLTAGDVITLHNRTNTVTDAVTVTSIAGGVGAGHPNRTLSLKKLN